MCGGDGQGLVSARVGLGMDRSSVCVVLAECRCRRGGGEGRALARRGRGVAAEGGVDRRSGEGSGRGWGAGFVILPVGVRL